MDEQQTKIKQLIIEIQKEDENSLRYQILYKDLNELLSQIIKKRIYKYFNKEDDPEFEDIKMIIFTKVFKLIKENKLDPDRSPISFINKCIDNEVFSYFRKNKVNLLKYAEKFQNVEENDKNLNETWDSNSKNIQNNSIERDLNRDWYRQSILTEIKKHDFSKKEIQILNSYFTAVLESGCTLKEIAEEFNLTEQQVQRIIERAKKNPKIQETLKTLLQENILKKHQTKSEKKQNRPGTKQKKPGTELEVIDISTAYHNFDPDSYFICDGITEDSFIFKVKTNIFISFEQSGNMIVEIDPDFQEPDKKKLADVINQLNTYKIIAHENLKSEENLIKISGFHFSVNIEAFIKSYAPKKTEKEMREFLRKIVRYDQWRRYITRYKDDFLPLK